MIPIFVLGLAVAVSACGPTVSSSSTGGGFEDGVIAAMNQDRAAAGLGPLAWDGQLGPMAQNWSDQIAASGNLVHSNLGGAISASYMSAWRSLAENLLVAGGDLTPAGAESMWMNSPEHRANILNPSMDYVGIGTARDASGRLWVVAEFGAR
jgi:uncharacterized protein YkwD